LIWFIQGVQLIVKISFVSLLSISELGKASYTTSVLSQINSATNNNINNNVDIA
jgi:hypothetical protein